MSNLKALFTVKKTVILLALLIATALTFGIAAECVGTSEASGMLACPPGTVCAEWDVGGSSKVICCIPPEELGSNNFVACQEAPVSTQ